MSDRRQSEQETGPERIAREKQRLRRELVARRSAVESADRERFSGLVCGHIRSSAQWAEATLVLLYAPAVPEVDVLPLAADALREGKRVGLPR